MFYQPRKKRALPFWNSHTLSFFILIRSFQIFCLFSDSFHHCDSESALDAETSTAKLQTNPENLASNSGAQHQTSTTTPNMLVLAYQVRLKICYSLFQEFPSLCVSWSKMIEMRWPIFILSILKPRNGLRYSTILLHAKRQKYLKETVNVEHSVLLRSKNSCK